MKTLYHSYQQSLAIFQAYAASHPHLVKLETIGTTWEGRELIALTITDNVAQAATKPALLYTGTMHAREWVGHELAIGFVRHILENMDYDPTIQYALQRATLYVVPCMNPDGLEFSRNHYSFWRKNKRINEDGSFGVDLNRNFPVGFKKIEESTSNVYAGPAPLSEPESQALKQFIDQHDNITLYLDYHSQGNVFFPAHNFHHEDSWDTTDLNTLCANMAYEIRKVSNRVYGIHQGKPPAKLVSGSAREYCYAKGILAAVVEVGTRNISDYLDDMQENLKEQFPALLRAMQTAPHYSRQNPLRERIQQFQIAAVSANAVSLTWDYTVGDHTYFEVYRSLKDKQHCNDNTLIGRTRTTSYEDNTVNSATDYYYSVRAVDRLTKLKSPLPPRIQLQTPVGDTEYHRTYFCLKNRTGYVAELSDKNRAHFGVNSLFAGINEAKGICYSLISFALETLPANARITSAKVSIYPMNRVSTTIERYGQWSIGIVKPPEDSEAIYDYASVKALEVLTYVDRPVDSEHLTQGIWLDWYLSEHECDVLANQIKNGEVLFRMEGPNDLRLGRHSQMMQWDIGYGQFGSGIHYRPKIEITYTLEPQEVRIYPDRMLTFVNNNGSNSNNGLTVLENRLIGGYRKEAQANVGYFEISLSSLPDYENTVITRAYIQMTVQETNASEKVRLHLELIRQPDWEQVQTEGTEAFQELERIDYDISARELSTEQTCYLKFATFSLLHLNEARKRREKVHFRLRPTTSRTLKLENLVEWHTKDKSKAPLLVIQYLKKRRQPVPKVSNLRISDDNGQIKLSWDNPLHDDFRGVRVIRNAFREPRSPYDGDKLYGGQDEYTYDTFGAKDISKYYAVFTYDDVPNYSEATVVHYAP